MATIGTFTSTEDGFTGSIRTLALNVKLVSAGWRTRPTGSAVWRLRRECRARCGLAEAIQRKRPRLPLVKLDDPSFSAPIYAMLTHVDGEDGCQLILSRLVSPRREQKQEEGAVDDTKTDVLAIASPTEAPAKENLNSADQPAGLEPLDRDPADPVSAELAPADEAESQTHDAADGVGTDVAAVAGAASSDDTQSAVTVAHDAAERQPGVEGAARRHRSRAKKAGEAVVAGVHSATDDEISLDEEIRVLKGQLASKLQMQTRN